MFAKHDDMLDRVPHIPVTPRPAPRHAPATREEARIVIEDAIALLPMSEIPKAIARALLKGHSPEVVEAMANEIGRHAHIAGRG